MIDISKYEQLFDQHVVVRCTDGEVLKGILSDWTSAEDNEPDPESIIIDTVNALIEIFIGDIESITDGTVKTE